MNIAHETSKYLKRLKNKKREFMQTKINDLQSCLQAQM